MGVRTAVLGASGYAGAELLRLLAGHPEFAPVLATGDRSAGSHAAEVYPSLAAAYPDLVFSGLDLEALQTGHLDLVFCALPHGESQRIVPQLRGAVGHIVDLAAAFRLKDASLYPTWYGEEHQGPELLVAAAVGIPALF